MHRKGFLKNVGITGLGIPFVSAASFKSYGQKKEVISDRQYWINTLTKIIDPVLNSLSKEQLTQKMPVKGKAAEARKQFAYLEAFGRLMRVLHPGWNWVRIIQKKED